MDNEYGNGENLRTLVRILKSTRDVPISAVHTMLTESYPYEECYED